MRKYIQDALLSVGEVAVFAWSLLELLLTRILPLAGLLAAHLLLQFCRLLGWREPQPDVKAEELVEPEELNEEDNAQVVKENGLESLKSNDKLEESLILPDEDADVHASAAATNTDANTAIITDAAPELFAEQVDVSESVAGANEVEMRGSDYGHVADVVGEEQGHVWANPEGSVRIRRMRVLPPSLSQIKRTLMQSPSPSSTPSPLKKKKQNMSPRSRKLASPAIKSSDNFMGKFRKHFLLDPS